MTKTEIMEALKAEGIDFKPAMSKGELEALLPEADEKGNDGENSGGDNKSTNDEKSSGDGSGESKKDSDDKEKPKKAKGTIKLENHRKGAVIVCGVHIEGGKSHSFKSGDLDKAQKQQLANTLKAGLLVEA